MAALVGRSGGRLADEVDVMGRGKGGHDELFCAGAWGARWGEEVRRGLVA